MAADRGFTLHLSPNSPKEGKVWGDRAAEHSFVSGYFTIETLDDVIGPSPLWGDDIAQRFGGSKFTAEIRRRRRPCGYTTVR